MRLLEKMAQEEWVNAEDLPNHLRKQMEQPKKSSKFLPGFVVGAGGVGLVALAAKHQQDKRKTK